MKKLKFYLMCYLCLMGFSSLVFLIVSAAVPEIILPLLQRLLALMAIGSIPNFVFAAMLFRKGLAPKAMWVRRVIHILLASFSYIAVSLLMGLLTLDDPEKIAVYAVSMTVSALLAACAIFIIADKREKKLFKELNDKLTGNEK